MIIGLDASRAFLKNRTGIEEYSYQVIKHLTKYLENSRVVLYIRKNQESRIRNQEFFLPEKWKVKVIKFPYLWTQVGLSLEMFFHPVDELFIPAHVVPFIRPKNSIVVVHGLEYEFCPKAYSFWEKFYMRLSIKNSCRWAKTIVAVSENTKKDLISLYGVAENKIKVVYEGYEDNGQGAVNSEQKKYPYLLFVGRLEERKNICGIISAFETLKEKYKIPHKLVLAGKPGYGYEKIRDKIQETRYKNDIILAGFINEDKKRDLIKNADIFLFPTFYEGFGLPILEAQSAGVPVVASNNSSIPEITTNYKSNTNIQIMGKNDLGSALLVDADKSEEIAEASYRLISDQSLRDDIIKKGLENVKRFSWEKCAEEIAEVLMK